MPKPRRIAQRKRAKQKEIEIPDYLKRISVKKLFKKPGLKNHYDQRDATPYNCSLLARGEADDNGGGMIYK